MSNPKVAQPNADVFSELYRALAFEAEPAGFNGSESNSGWHSRRRRNLERAKDALEMIQKGSDRLEEIVVGLSREVEKSSIDSFTSASDQLVSDLPEFQSALKKVKSTVNLHYRIHWAGRDE